MNRARPLGLLSLLTIWTLFTRGVEARLPRVMQLTAP